MALPWIAATNYAAVEGRAGLTGAEEQSLRREWARHEAVMRSIAEPQSQEHGIALRAAERISAVCKELGLDDAVVELAHQVRFHPPPPLRGKFEGPAVLVFEHQPAQQHTGNRREDFFLQSLLFAWWGEEFAGDNYAEAQTNIPQE